MPKHRTARSVIILTSIFLLLACSLPRLPGARRPVCTPPPCATDEVYHCPGKCPGGCGTQCATPTPGPTATFPPRPVCTPPPCATDEVYHCPDECPGGCGTECATPTPLPTQEATPTIVIEQPPTATPRPTPTYSPVDNPTPTPEQTRINLPIDLGSVRTTSCLGAQAAVLVVLAVALYFAIRSVAVSGIRRLWKSKDGKSYYTRRPRQY